MTDEEIRNFCRILYPAGSDTTYMAIGSMFDHVLADESLRAKAMKNDDERARIVEETLRMDPPIALQGRMATGSVDIGNAAIRYGDACLFAIAAANRDERYFPEPNRFNPDRNNNELMTFARGPHFCLGLHLARREMQVALKVVLECFPRMCLSPDRPREEIVQTVLRGPRQLWVRPYGP